MDKKGVEIDRKGDQKKCSPLDTVNWKKTQKRNTLNSFPKILFCAIYRVFDKDLPRYIQAGTTYGLSLPANFLKNGSSNPNNEINLNNYKIRQS